MNITVCTPLYTSLATQEMRRVSTLPTQNGHKVQSYPSDLTRDPLAGTTPLMESKESSRVHYLQRQDMTLVEYSERHPPLVGLVGMASAWVEMNLTNKRSRDSLDPPLDDPPLVQTDWHTNEPGPFLGDLELGKPQLAMVNALSRAPVFPHKAPGLLLLIKQPNGDFSATQISTIFLCGQTEPQSICVPIPLTNKPMRSQEMALALGISRLLESSHGVLLTKKDIRSRVLSLYSRHNRKWLIKKFDELIDRIGYHVVQSSKDGTALAKDDWKYRLRNNTLPSYFQADSLKKAIVPEQVCAEQSSLAAEYRLRQVGITSYPSLDLITAWISQMEKLRVFRETRVRVFLTERANPNPLIDYLVREIVQLDRCIETGRFILYQLQRAPWNTTSTFFVTLVEPDNKGVMTIDSGDVDEFTFVRLNDQRHQPAKCDSLRKMKTEDARKLLNDGFGLPLEEINSLKNRSRLIKRVAESAKQAKDSSFITACNLKWKIQKQRLTSSSSLHCHDDDPEEEEEEEEEDKKVTKVIDFISSTQKQTSQQENDRRDLDGLRSVLHVFDAAVAASCQPRPPRQVVRRTVRTISEDGTERVTFQFLFEEGALKSAMKLQRQKEG